MTNIVIGLCTDMTNTQRQSGLRALKGLPGSSSQQSSRIYRERQIHPDDAPEFLLEARIIGQS